jgi:hypothetical protein
MKKVILLATFIISFNGVVIAQNDDAVAFHSNQKNGFSLGANLFYSLAFESNKFNVSNVPLSIRNVPIHKDDRNIPTSDGPINDTLMHGNEWKLLMLGFSTQVRFKAGNFKAEIGGKASYNYNLASTGEIAERNYTNYPGTAERGEGAALTYYTVYPAGFEYGPYAKISWGWFAIEDYFDFSAVRAKNGWDRYDALQTYSTYPLYNLNSNILKAIVEVDRVRFYAGYTLNTYAANPVSPTLVFNNPKHLLCGVEISIF